MIIIKANKYSVNERYQTIGNPHEYEFRGETAKEAMERVMGAKENNDLTKYTPLNIYNVIEL